jgi:hypothetical protein
MMLCVILQEIFTKSCSKIKNIKKQWNSTWIVFKMKNTNSFLYEIEAHEQYAI